MSKGQTSRLMEQLKQGDTDVYFYDGCLSDIEFVYRKDFSGDVVLSQDFPYDGCEE